ncbi:MAG TPA: hypothetical protein EYP48_02420, partial [Ignisphaera sp.]|nr:hypothetical protein [Ignisphaera sp.]
MRPAAWAGIAIALLIVGVVVGYFAGTAGAGVRTVTVPITVTQTLAPATVTVTKTVTVGAVTKPEYTFYYISHGGPADPWWAPV